MRRTVAVGISAWTVMAMGISMADKVVRIGCCSGFWGDSTDGARQLVAHGKVDYLVGDYLAEITMSLLAKSKMKDSALGYTPDFVDAIAPLLPEIAQGGIKVVANAGGLNPEGCRAALANAARAAGVPLRIAVVEGDDLMPQLGAIRGRAPVEVFSGAPFPAQPVSVNAYLGARPIATALDGGAQIVVMGRCVDSALVLGPLMHEFGWSDTDYHLLSAGSLAGHLIECGAQCTGGLFTDWDSVPGWDDMGFPIAECRIDGTFTITKPDATGGLVTPASVGEQLLYEIGDPGAYLLPDVICDWTGVRLAQAGADRVEVTGATGRAPTSSYKVCATYGDGYRSLGTLMIGGFEAARKARRQGEAIIARARRLALAQGFGDFTESSVEVIGAEDTYGANARAVEAREVVLKVGVRHPEKEALEIFAREFAPSATAMAQGTTGLIGGRPSVAPVIRLFSFLIEKACVDVAVNLDGKKIDVVMHPGDPNAVTAGAPAQSTQMAATFAEPAVGIPVALRRIAWGRSGDKGDSANIGLIARRPEFASVIRDQVTPRRVAEYFAHYAPAEVTRWELPGMHAFNFVLAAVLGGGGIATLRYDPQGKAYAAMLLDLPVRVPDALLQEAR
jgi:hypothetical protein